MVTETFGYILKNEFNVVTKMHHAKRNSGSYREIQMHLKNNSGKSKMAIVFSVKSIMRFFGILV